MILASYNGTFFENVIDMIIHSIKHALLIIPFIFISFLLIEYLTHRHSKKINNLFTSTGKYAPVVGGTLGIVPQCGFSSTIATLFSNKIVTIGTLFAVLISTSDEAILILIAYPQHYLMLISLILIKLILGITIGLLIDFILPKQEIKQFETKTEEQCSCGCKHSILKGTLKHCLQIFLYLVIFSFIVDFVVYLIGTENLEKILLNGSIFQPILASIIGLIPNCAASVLLTELFVEGNISFASLLAGLISNAGIGILVLFKTNKNKLQNIKILGILVGIAISVGIITSLIMLLF